MFEHVCLIIVGVADIPSSVALTFPGSYLWPEQEFREAVLPLMYISVSLAMLSDRQGGVHGYVFLTRVWSVMAFIGAMNRHRVVFGPIRALLCHMFCLLPK